jgi:hypothetical protein
MSEHQIWVNYSCIDLTKYVAPGKEEFAIYGINNPFTRSKKSIDGKEIKMVALFYNFLEFGNENQDSWRNGIVEKFKHRGSKRKKPDLIIHASNENLEIKLSKEFTEKKSELTCFGYASNLLTHLTRSLMETGGRF